MSAAGDTVEVALRYSLNASKAACFAALTDVRDIMRYTRDKATSEPKAGGALELFGGSIQGSYVSADDSKIVLKWRLRNWEDGVYSNVVISLTPKGEDETEVAVKHTGIPSSDKYGHGSQEVAVKQGWQQRIFGGIKMMLGIGMEAEDE